MLKRLEVELHHGEGFGRGKEADLAAAATFIGAGLLVLDIGADLLERRIGLAMREAHLENAAITADIEFEPLAERIDHRDANTVQTARDLVGILVELTAGMELGHDDLGGRNALFLVDAGRDAATI